MGFKQFEVVAEVANDHYYLVQHEEENCLNYRRIIREWKILEKGLPKNIYVQTYASRMDLLRAVMVVSCPETSPYHDALFFFDIALPCDYPNQPPRVHYHSHGYRVHPNLFVGINSTQEWSEKSSTLLETLVSIQGLVLDYDGQSPYHSQKAFLLCWRSMLKIMRQPPQRFEDFVVQHFRRRNVCILTAMDKYYSVVASPTFKGDLIEIRKQLKNVFATFGTNIDDPTAQIQKWMGAIINIPIQIQKRIEAIINYPTQRFEDFVRRRNVCILTAMDKYYSVVASQTFKGIRKAFATFGIDDPTAQIQKWMGAIINIPIQIQKLIEAIINFPIEDFVVQYSRAQNVCILRAMDMYYSVVASPIFKVIRKAFATFGIDDPTPQIQKWMGAIINIPIQIQKMIKAIIKINFEAWFGDALSLIATLHLIVFIPCKCYLFLFKTPPSSSKTPPS